METPVTDRVVQLMCGNVTLITRHESQYRGRPESSSFYYLDSTNPGSELSFFLPEQGDFIKRGELIGVPLFDY